MERTRQRSLVVVPQDSAKAQAQPPKLRKKLQKSVTRQRNFTGGTFRGRLSSDTSDQAAASSDNKPDTTKTKRTVSARTQAQQPQPCLLPTLTPDLSDSKWSDYLLRETGCFCPDNSSTTRTSSLLLPPQPKDCPDVLLQPVQIVPELSHLAISNAKPPTPNPDSSSSDTTSPSPPVMTEMSQRRRRAKTPIFSIGQLESIPRPANAFASNEKRLSAEVMAEQYRALIASRNSMLKDTHSEPSQSRQGHRDDYDDRDDLFDDDTARNPHLSPPELLPLLPNRSPTNTSDDGTLVGFEEETVYFKPVSFSPEPMVSPDFESQQGFQSPPLPEQQIPGNLSLQICLDLLTRDLSSGLKGAGLSVGNRGGENNDMSNTSALQVWVMIEAYERLRDQLFAEAGSGRLREVGLEELGSMGLMMDMWLRALYSIHDGLVGGHGHGHGDLGTSDYDDLAMEELD
ncbi:hypothetical protein V8F06_000591 [Rhypophila decipiens]